MLTQKNKGNASSTHVIKDNKFSPFSILSLGLLGQNNSKKPIKDKPKKQQKQMKTPLSVKPAQINDENHNSSNYLQPSTLMDNTERVNEKKIFKVEMESREIQKIFCEPTFDKVELQEYAFDENGIFQPEKLSFLNITH